MRRLLVACAVTLVLLAAFAVAQKNLEVRAATGAQGAENTSGIVSARKVTVAAAATAARALALNSLDPNAKMYLTNASAPDQLFALPALTPESPVSSLRLSAVAGTGAIGSLGDGGTAIAAQLSLTETSPFERSGVASAADGTVYIADTGNATIRAIAGADSNEPGVIRSAAGRWGPRQQVTLVEPMGIAADAAGNVYIADHAAGSVDVMPSNGGQLEILAHVASPASLAVTRDGSTLFVASPEAGAVFAITTQTRALAVVAGAVQSAGSATSPCLSSTAMSAAQQICPSGLAVDNTGHLYISDLNSGRILTLAPQATALTTFASGLSQPGSLVVDAAGNLYAAEQGLNRIVAFAQTGTSQGSISLTPASASYGNTPSGGSTATQSFTLSNTSSTVVTGLSIPKTTSPADFTVQANSCTSTLAVNANCSLSVSFTPTASGARSDTLTVTDSSSSDSASTVLSGTGDDFQIQLASTQLMSVSVEAGNAATFNLQVVPNTVFSGIVTLVCPTNLPTNTTCAFSSPTVNVTAGTPAPFSVTFQTTGIINPLSNSFSPVHKLPPDIPAFPATVLVSIAALLSLLILRAQGRSSARSNAFRSVMNSNWSIAATFALTTLAFVALAGCSKGESPASVGATPAGTSTMAITGTSQNASRALTITLNVVTE